MKPLKFVEIALTVIAINKTVAIDVLWVNVFLPMD